MTQSTMLGSVARKENYMEFIKLKDLLPHIQGVAYIDSDSTTNCLARINHDGSFVLFEFYSKEMLLLTNVQFIEAFPGSGNTDPYIRIEVFI